jgi:hypothetical protein
MNNGDQPAFARSYAERTSETHPDALSSWSQVGLTKREMIAAMAMQGILAAPKDKFTFHQDHIVSMSVRYADELLKQLESK